MSNLLYDVAREALVPPERLAVDEWLRQNVVLEDRTAFPGPLDVRNSPWLLRPFQDLTDHSIREIILTCSVQSGKTIFLEGGMLYWIAQIGGDLALYLQTDESATRFLHKRFKLKILKCDAVCRLLSNGKRSIQKHTIDFAHMTQYVLGAENEDNVQSLSVKSVWGDESAYWKKGRIGESRKRTTAFDRNGSKRTYIGTPKDAEGEYFDSYNAGTLSQWQIKCPACNHQHQMRWANIKWDAQKALLDNGWHNPAIIRATTRYVCPECTTEFHDEPITRQKMAESGVYVDLNPAPDPRVRSYHWNSLTVPWIEWGDLAVEFAMATSAKKLGDLGPLREFITKKLAEFWDPRLYETESVKISGGFCMLEPWEDEHVRFLTVDKQKDYYRLVVRLWAKNGASRLFYAGQCDTWGQIREFQELHNIKNGHVMVDCGYNQNEVARECAKFGWWPVHGDGAASYSWHRRQRGSDKVVAIRRPYIQRTIDTGQGLHRDERIKLLKELGGRSREVKSLLWSSDYMKFILFQLRGGRGAEWLVASDAPAFYMSEIQNEILGKHENKQTGKIRHFPKKIGPNHSFDCEAMQILAAYISKLLGQREDDDAEEGEAGLVPVN
jgi:hypothetical protein